MKPVTVRYSSIFNVYLLLYTLVSFTTISDERDLIRRPSTPARKTLIGVHDSTRSTVLRLRIYLLQGSNDRHLEGGGERPPSFILAKGGQPF